MDYNAQRSEINTIYIFTILMCAQIEDSNFFKEVPRLIKDFWYTFIYAICCLILIIFGVFIFPWNWRINEIIAIFPLALSAASHFLLLIVLNPALMQFT